MNRRGFLVVVAAIPAALLAGIPRPRLDWTSFNPPNYSAKPFIEWQRAQIAMRYRVPVQLLGEDGSSTFGVWEGTETELAEFKREWIKRTGGDPEGTV